MPMMVKGRLLSNREQVGKMTMRELVDYAEVLEKFMASNSPMIAITLKQVYQEIEWRNAAHPQSHGP